jgi:hypothetical protein
MAARPFDWKEWFDARWWMRIYDVWGWGLPAGDEAFVSSLRRLIERHEVRGNAYEADSIIAYSLPNWDKPLDFREVVRGLLKVVSYGSGSAPRTVVEYEATEMGSVIAPVGMMYPAKVKKTAVLIGAEVAFKRFKDDLITYEWPADAKPLPPTRRRSRQTSRRRRGPMPGRTGFLASDRLLFPEMRLQLKRLAKENKRTTNSAAASVLVAVGGVAGAGTPKSKATRLARNFGKHGAEPEAETLCKLATNKIKYLGEQLV